MGLNLDTSGTNPLATFHSHTDEDDAGNKILVVTGGGGYDTDNGYTDQITIEFGPDGAEYSDQDGNIIDPTTITEAYDDIPLDPIIIPYRPPENWCDAIGNIKLRFFDTRLLQKLQKTYGKHQFLEALEIILQLLKVMTPEEILHKIHLQSNIDVDMRRALLKLGDLLQTPPDSGSPIPIRLSKGVRQMLDAKIQHLLDWLDTSLETSPVTPHFPSELESSMAQSHAYFQQIHAWEDRWHQQGKARIRRHFLVVPGKK